jgi:HPt (histidine-containing phosphotransfer) domain-containing protein
MSMDEPEILDPQLLENLRSLQDPGDPDLAIEIISLFLSDSAARLERMRDAATRRDLLVIAELAHQMKGSAGALSAGRLLQISAELEHVARYSTPDAEAIALLITRLERRLDEVRVALGRLGFPPPASRL